MQEIRICLQTCYSKIQWFVRVSSCHLLIATSSGNSFFQTNPHHMWLAPPNINAHYWGKSPLLSHLNIWFGAHQKPVLFWGRRWRLILATPLVYVSGLSVAAANGVPQGAEIWSPLHWADGEDLVSDVILCVLNGGWISLTTKRVS